MFSQKHLGLKHISHLKGLKLAEDIRAENIKVLIRADILETLHRLMSYQEPKENP